MTRVALIILAVASVFLFPWPYAALLIFAAALYVPLIALSLGLLYDALYFTHGWPVATLLGALGSIAAYYLAQFIRTRVSDVTL